MGLFNATDQWRGFFGCPLMSYDEDLEIDEQAYIEQVDFLISNGAPALCALTHIAESINLSTDERERIAGLTVEAAAGRVPVVIHVSCPSTAHTIQFARHAQRVGADGVLVVTPYHWRPADAALFQHFVRVGESAEVDLVAYSYPAAMGTAVSPKLAARLIEQLPNFLGMKMADYDMQSFTELVRVTHNARHDFSVFSGLEYLQPAVALGACGSFSACGVVAPRLLLKLWESTIHGGVAEARALQWRVSELWHLLQPRYPATVKAAADALGRTVGPTRLPVLPLSRDERVVLARGLEELGIFDEEPYGWAAGAEPDPERAKATAGSLASA